MMLWELTGSIDYEWQTRKTPGADSKQDAWKIALPLTVTGTQAVDVYSTSV